MKSMVSQISGSAVYLTSSAACRAARTPCASCRHTLKQRPSWFSGKGVFQYWESPPWAPSTELEPLELPDVPPPPSPPARCHLSLAVGVGDGHDRIRRATRLAFLPRRCAARSGAALRSASLPARRTAPYRTALRLPSLQVMTAERCARSDELRRERLRESEQWDARHRQ